MSCRLVAAIAAFGVACAATAAKIEIAQDNADALYKSGEPATFTITVKDDSGGIMKEGTASWTIDNFGTK